MCNVVAAMPMLNPHFVSELVDDHVLAGLGLGAALLQLVPHVPVHHRQRPPWGTACQLAELQTNLREV